MYLLYVDESGHSADPNQEFFVLAGVAVFERRGYWISKKLDDIAARFNPSNPAEIELHGSPMKQGRDQWNLHNRADREQAIIDSLECITAHADVRLFASIVNKAAIGPKDPVLVAFEQLTTRFDAFLRRLHRKKDTQRGLILFDESAHEESLQSLATTFREVGHSWGVLNNLSEVPVFLDSRASRLIQLADLVAYSVFRNWERKDSKYYDVIRNSFDREGGICHGLHVSG